MSSHHVNQILVSNFGGFLDILRENRQVMQLLAGSRWGVCWKTRGGGENRRCLIENARVLLYFVLRKCILLLKILLAENLDLILCESKPSKSPLSHSHTEPA